MTSEYKRLLGKLFSTPLEKKASKHTSRSEVSVREHHNTYQHESEIVWTRLPSRCTPSLLLLMRKVSPKRSR